VKALVTGSSGFIGSHLTEILIDRGCDVHILLRKSSDRTWTRRLNARPVFGDYNDPESLRTCVTGMDVVFHLAAVLKAYDWNTYYRVNTLGTKNLLQACLAANENINRFVFVSSIAAAGPASIPVFRDESSPDQPDSFYGKSKLLAEQEVWKYQDRLPVTIARPPNVVGTRQQELLMILKLLKKRIFPLLGKQIPQTSLCFVQDLVEALILMSENSRAVSRLYYITDNKGYSWRNLLEILARLLNVYPPMVLKIPYPVLLAIARLSEAYAAAAGTEPFISPRYIISTRHNFHLYRSLKIKKELGFNTQIPVLQGMKHIIRDYKREGLL
jgi:dihydroflavonol-4-reductase